MEALKKKNDSFVSSYLLYLLAAASHAASGQFHVTVRAAGLRIIEWRVLACLIDQDGEMITRLAKYALIEQSRLTRIIDQMDERGLIDRKPDPEDGRRVRIYLTARGRKLANTLVRKARVHEAELLQALHNAGGENIKLTLKTLIDNLDGDG